MDINVANLICNTCLENVENFYKFKRRFKNTADILKDFSKNYTVSSNEPELVNNEPELTTNVNIIDENGTVIEEYQQLDKTEYEEFVDESYVEGAEEMDYNDLIVEAPKEEIDTAYPRKDLQISPKTKKLFKCGHCHKVLKRLESCKSHMRNHLNLRNYGCKICFKVNIFQSIKHFKSGIL